MQINIIHKKKPLKMSGFFCLWYLPDLNWGHTDFQSVALPTELRYQPSLLEASAKIKAFLIYAKKTKLTIKKNVFQLYF